MLIKGIEIEEEEEKKKNINKNDIKIFLTMENLGWLSIGKIIFKNGKILHNY